MRRLTRRAPWSRTPATSTAKKAGRGGVAALVVLAVPYIAGAATAYVRSSGSRRTRLNAALRWPVSAVQQRSFPGARTSGPATGRTLA